jgi:hypothetical protein
MTTFCIAIYESYLSVDPEELIVEDLRILCLHIFIKNSDLGGVPVTAAIGRTAAQLFILAPALRQTKSVKFDTFHVTIIVH